MLKPISQAEREPVASAGPGDAGTQQPPLPCLIEYMARNEYWLGEPEVLRALFARAESGEAWAQYRAGKLCYEGGIVFQSILLLVIVPAAILSAVTEFTASWPAPTAPATTRAAIMA